MVADDRKGSTSGDVRHHPAQDGGCVRSAIDQVADIDDDPRRAGAMESLEQLLELIDAAVDVADDVERAAEVAPVDREGTGHRGDDDGRSRRRPCNRTSV